MSRPCRLAALLGMAALGCDSTTPVEKEQTEETTAAEGTGESACVGHLTAEDCAAAGSQCEFLAGAEVVLEAGECVDKDVDVGWCSDTIWGGADSPSWWFEEATGRVVGFPLIPSPGLEGWYQCCDETIEPPEACKCVAPAYCFVDGTTTQ